MGAQWLNNNNRTTALELTAAEVIGGLHTFNLRQILALDSAVVKTNEVFSSHGVFLKYAMYKHRATI